MATFVVVSLGTWYVFRADDFVLVPSFSLPRREACQASIRRERQQVRVVVEEMAARRMKLKSSSGEGPPPPDATADRNGLIPSDSTPGKGVA